MNRKVITMCLFNRPDYTEQVLACLAQCDGIGDYLLLPHVEPGCDRTRALVEAVDFCQCCPVFNRERLGVNRNTLTALNDGFVQGRYVVHVEEDVLLAPDALRFFEHSRDAYAGDGTIVSVTAYHKTTALPASADWHTLGRRDYYHCWGWATWSDRFRAFRRTLVNGLSNGATWDTTLLNQYVRTKGLWEVYPLLSRSQNIGAVSTIHPASDFFTPEWHANNHRTPHWAGDVAVSPGAFVERIDPVRIV